jgi:predicted membrane-bound spermidine synthase
VVGPFSAGMASLTAGLVVGFYLAGVVPFGRLVGGFTIAVGVGPRTVRDVVYHAVILALVAWRLVFAARSPRNAQPPRIGEQ